MDKFFMPDVSKAQRLEVLQDNADKIEAEFNYSKDLTKDELDIVKDDFSQNALKIHKFDEVLKEAKDRHKTDTTPLKNQNKALLEQIKTKRVDVTGKVYLMADQEEGVMLYYNEEGQLVHFRPLQQNERQARMFSIKDESNGTFNQ